MQGGKPELSWIFENCLVPELKRMSPAVDAGYYTDFRGNVLIPDYRPNNTALVNAEFRDAALLCWMDMVGDSRTVSAPGFLGDAHLHWGLYVYFIGGIKTDRGIQIATANSASDHMRTMRKNPSRDQVGGSALNTYGINTNLVENYRFIWDQIDQGIGKWDCVWCIDFSAPTAG